MNAKVRPTIARTIAILAGIALVGLAGCATTRVKVTPLAPSAKDIGELNLAGIELESIYSYTQSLSELEAVIVSSARSAGIAIHPRADGDGTDGQGRNAISVFIREQSYTKGFKTMLSLAIIADIRAPDGRIIMRAEWFHDGEESFDSLGYLSASMRATFRKISKTMQKSK